MSCASVLWSISPEEVGMSVPPGFSGFDGGSEGMDVITGFDAEFTFESGGDPDLTPSVANAVKAVKPGLRWLWDWHQGYWVVLMGPSLAGKTRLLRYLYTQKLEEDDPTELARAKAR